MEWRKFLLLTISLNIAGLIVEAAQNNAKINIKTQRKFGCPDRFTNCHAEINKEIISECGHTVETCYSLLDFNYNDVPMQFNADCDNDSSIEGCNYRSLKCCQVNKNLNEDTSLCQLMANDIEGKADKQKIVNGTPCSPGIWIDQPCVATCERPGLNVAEGRKSLVAEEGIPLCPGVRKVEKSYKCSVYCDTEVIDHNDITTTTTTTTTIIDNKPDSSNNQTTRITITESACSPGHWLGEEECNQSICEKPGVNTKMLKRILMEDDNVPICPDVVKFEQEFECSVVCEDEEPKDILINEDNDNTLAKHNNKTNKLTSKEVVIKSDDDDDDESGVGLKTGCSMGYWVTENCNIKCKQVGWNNQTLRKYLVPHRNTSLCPYTKMFEQQLTCSKFCKKEDVEEEEKAVKEQLEIETQATSKPCSMGEWKVEPCIRICSKPGWNNKRVENKLVLSDDDIASGKSFCPSITTFKQETWCAVLCP
eukprot:Pgem_evm1s1377